MTLRSVTMTPRMTMSDPSINHPVGYSFRMIAATTTAAIGDIYEKMLLSDALIL